MVETLALPGGTLSYLDEGPREAPVVVMLHGNPTGAFYYRHLIAGLRNRFRLIVPDHMGCGASSRPVAPYPRCLAQHINNLETLLNALNIERCSLMMHDWGGAIAMGYAVRHRHRIDRLIVCNTAAFHLPRLPFSIRLCRLPLIGHILVQGLNGFVEGGFRMATSQPERFNAQVRALYRQPWATWRDRRTIKAFIDDIPLETQHPSRALLDEIEQGLNLLAAHPMQIFWGMDDFCFTARDFLPEWTRRFPQAHVMRLDRAGHYVLEDAHERIVPVLRTFLLDSAPVI